MSGEIHVFICSINSVHRYWLLIPFNIDMWICWCADTQLSYSDICDELKNLFTSNSQDVPKILRLLRSSFTERRKAISELADAEVCKIVEQFEYLQDIRFVSV
jgi:hypothetical protein